jgi:transglutaminase-like putative cysteine protease
MSRLLLLAASLLTPAVAVAQTPAVRIEATPHQTVDATIRYEIRTTNFAVSRWTVFLPEPPELPSQRKLRTACKPAGKVVQENSPLARPVRMLDIPVDEPVAGAKLAMTLDVHATLVDRRLVPLRRGEQPPVVRPLPADERKYYLAPSSRVDFEEPPFQEWLDAKKLRRGPDEPPIEFAARVLGVIRSDFAYRFVPADDRRASVACRQGKTDCGGMAFLFVAAMRANGVPARVLVGRLAKPRKPDSTPDDLEYDRPHVRAEFFVGGVGWVPVDPNYANMEKVAPVAGFVGRDPGDMVVLHVDLDLKLPFADRDRTVDMMQVGAAYWLTGRGPFDAVFGPTGWDVTAAPIGQR